MWKRTISLLFCFFLICIFMLQVKFSEDGLTEHKSGSNKADGGLDDAGYRDLKTEVNSNNERTPSPYETDVRKITIFHSFFNLRKLKNEFEETALKVNHEEIDPVKIEYDYVENKKQKLSLMDYILVGQEIYKEKLKKSDQMKFDLYEFNENETGKLQNEFDNYSGDGDGMNLKRDSDDGILIRKLFKRDVQNSDPLVTVDYDDHQIINGTKRNNTGKLTFRPLLHQPRIYYGAPPGVHVTTIHAYDPEKPRKVVEYSLSDILDYKTFVIDQMSGNITTAKHIDRPINQTYEVMVAALSMGSSELEHIQIIVTEFNQYAPRFEDRNYTVVLHPITDVNTTVLRVNAVDPDITEENAEIYYKLDQNATTKYFRLNYITGDLTLIQPINETTSVLCFGIFAEDGGSPKRWDYVPVYVHLQNISEPYNVQVSDISFSNATVCWEEPYYGDILGYTISYWSAESLVKKNENITVDYDMDFCLVLWMLYDDTEYFVQLYGWNENEKGKSSQPIKFKTAKNWCKNISCHNGSCEPLLEEPWYTCHCEWGYYGPHCDSFDVCIYDPCGRNGKCKLSEDSAYECICNEDYFGPNCEFFNPCKTHPGYCQNGGTCSIGKEKKMECICPEGFNGPRCSLNNLCSNNPCLNDGKCQQYSNYEFICICPTGFQGDQCEHQINYCNSNPCYKGTCQSNIGNFTCICPPGYYGSKCNMIKKCSERSDYAMDVLFKWNRTDFGTIAMNNCPFGTVQSLNRKGHLKRVCELRDNRPKWGEIDVSECRPQENIEEIAAANKKTSKLQNITKNPENLDADTIESASDELVSVAMYATDKQLAQDVLNVISNVLEGNESVFEKTDQEVFDNIRSSIEVLSSTVHLEPGERLNIETENVRIESLNWHPDLDFEPSDEHMELTAPMFKESDFEDEIDEDAGKFPSFIVPNTTDESLSTPIIPITKPTTDDEGITPETTQKPKFPIFQVFVPKEALQEAHRQLETNVRVKFVVYYNNKLFQPRKSEKPTIKPVIDKESPLNTSVTTEIAPIKIPVLQISLGNIALKNLQKPLIYVLPMITSQKAKCVFWNEEEKNWSKDGLETEQKIDKVICKSSHMTAFSILLDLDPGIEISDRDYEILSIVSYVGSGLSIFGLIATIITYSLFKCLRRDNTGPILINLCLALLSLNIEFLVGASSLVKSRQVCGMVAVSMHYSVISSLCWMGVEALNMYQLLVYVFASSESHFLLKRMLAAWGMPFILVLITACFKFEAYTANTEECVISNAYPWIYYGTFILPSCCLLIINGFVFFRVSKVIFTPNLKIRSHSSNENITATQVRGTFTVMILLGITWILGTFTFGPMKIVFMYIFCLLNPPQGFLIFVVRCLCYKEAKDAWIVFFKTGKLKSHRGVVPPGTVSYNSHSGVRSGVSPSTNVRTDSTDEPSSEERKRSTRQQQTSRLESQSPRQIILTCKRSEKHPNSQRKIRSEEPQPEQCEKKQFYRRNSKKTYGHYDSFEMRMRPKKECSAFEWVSSSYQGGTLAATTRFPPNELENIRLKKTQNFEANKNLSLRLEENRKDFKKTLDIPSMFEDNDTLSCSNYSHRLPHLPTNGREFASPDHLIRKNTIFGDTPSSSSLTSRKKYMRRQKRMPINTFSLDVDDEIHSDQSSSTDFDDGTFRIYKASPRPTPKKK